MTEQDKPSIFDEGRVGAKIASRILGKRQALEWGMFYPKNISKGNLVVYSYIDGIDGPRANLLEDSDLPLDSTDSELQISD